MHLPSRSALFLVLQKDSDDGYVATNCICQGGPLVFALLPIIETKKKQANGKLQFSMRI